VAKKASDESRYKSRYATDTFITAAQYLAELMIERQTLKKGRKPPMYFWKLPQYEKAYRLQLRHANTLIRLYSAPAVSRALRRKEAKGLYSLGAPWLDDLVKQENAAIQAEQQRQAERQTPAPEASPNLPAGPRPAFVNQKSTLNKLKELDG